MARRISDRNIWLIFFAIFLVGIAYGVSISLTALHLDARGFRKEQIGTLAAWFASGIVVLSLPMGALIRRFSAKTALLVALLGYAACVSIFPHLTTYGGIAGARFFDGAFSVGVWVSCETILLARADADHKAFVTSLYAVSMAIGYVLGPLAARAIVSSLPMSLAFGMSGVLATSAAAAVAIFLDRGLPARAAAEDGAARAVAAEGRASSLAILAQIKTSCFATFAYGYFQASVVLFLPLYLMEEKGILREQTIVIPAFFAAGMLLFSNVAGRIGDRFGHLVVMRVLGAVGTVMILGFVFLDAYWLMCAAVFVAGASLASISPVSLALQGVIVDPADYSRSNAIYNVFYAAGMLLGPPASSVLFERGGGAVMLEHLAALWVAFVVFAWLFAGDDPRARRAAPSRSAAPRERAA